MALNYEVKKRVFGFDETKTEMPSLTVSSQQVR